MTHIGITRKTIGKGRFPLSRKPELSSKVLLSFTAHGSTRRIVIRISSRKLWPPSKKTADLRGNTVKSKRQRPAAKRRITRSSWPRGRRNLEQRNQEPLLRLEISKLISALKLSPCESKQPADGRWPLRLRCRSELEPCKIYGVCTPGLRD